MLKPLNERFVLVNNCIRIMIYTPAKLTLDTSEVSQSGGEGVIGHGMQKQLQSRGDSLGVSLLKFKFVWLLNSAPKCALVNSAICLNLCDSFSSTPLTALACITA